MRAPALERQGVIEVLSRQFPAGSEELVTAITDKKLYFRVSIIGSCNLACSFCHNEGGPDAGRINVDLLKVAVRAAVNVGFSRVQLTGGEPLLHPQVAQCVQLCREYMPDVGVTTNGTYLANALPALFDAGVTRIHVSLQKETLQDPSGQWSVPSWLNEVVDQCNKRDIFLRFNLPVGPLDVEIAKRFLNSKSHYFAVNIFALLEPRQVKGRTAKTYLNGLRSLVRESEHPNTVRASVSMRSYLTPSGLRCVTCSQRSVCTEASRSLRLGVDGQLRPCLATRYWDSPFRVDEPDESMREATLLALDY